MVSRDFVQGTQQYGVRDARFQAPDPKPHSFDSAFAPVPQSTEAFKQQLQEATKRSLKDSAPSSGDCAYSGAVPLSGTLHFGPQSEENGPWRSSHSLGKAPAQRHFRNCGGAFGVAGVSYDDDPNDDPPDINTKRHLELEDRRKKDTLINNDYLRTSKFVARGIPRCEVEKFERQRYAHRTLDPADGNLTHDLLDSG